MTRDDRAYWVVAVILSVSAGGRLDAQDCPCRPEAKPGQAVIQLTEEVLASLPEDVGSWRAVLSERLQVPVLDVLDEGLGFFLVQVGEAFVGGGFLSELEARPDVRLAERNQVYRGATDDPDWRHQWGLDNTGEQTFCGSVDGETDIQVEAAWAIAGRGGGVVVAVIDSGVVSEPGDARPAHLDLNGPTDYWRNQAEVGGAFGTDDDGNRYVDDLWGWDFVDGDNHPRDEVGHGTFVAAILAAEADNHRAIAGVAPDATILHLRYLDRRNRGDLAAAIKAIEYAARQEASVVNMSWTACEPDRALETAIRERSEVVFVAAAGNSQRSLRRCPEYPAAFGVGGELPNLVSVMGVCCDRNRVPSSNWDADLAAPGALIAAFDHRGSRKFPNGTSMAAPHVSGVAALLLGHEPALSAAEVVERLECTADSTKTAGLQVEFGILDAAAAVRGGC